jgi:adenine phosphoribosyltransferase
VDQLKALVRDVPDFPHPGILFRDITPLLRDSRALVDVVERIADEFRDRRVDVVAGIESRGFLFGTPLALALRAGFVPIRKLGKLPARTLSRQYALEYGKNHLEIHADAIHPGERVLVVDDVLATGGTARAGAELVEELGGELLGTAFLIELTALGGRAALTPREVFSLLRY